ncbi:MAG: hypothetical protein E7212_09615 [Clostridium sartagoforme]|nr:hypothetical protein [Clostridium sartagoforme]
MNNKKRNKFILVSFILLLTNLIYGCKNQTDEIKKIEINNGAIAIEDNKNYTIYNLDNGKYEKVETDYIITEYDSESKNYIFNNNGEFKIQYLGEERNIDDLNKIISPKLSPGGNYLSYFVKDIYLNLKIKDLKVDKFVNIDSKVAISGQLIDWYNEDTLVYYGIDNEKNNGIFLYNISNNEEKLIYQLDAGYIQFLKVLDNGIVFLQEKEGKQKILKFIDENGELVQNIQDIDDISDVEYSKDGIFMIGKLKNNNYSLYEYNEGKIKRLVYDFPKIINLEKGLSKDSDGNILFIGGDEPNKEKVYIYEDGFVSELSNNQGNYNFIHYK